MTNPRLLREVGDLFVILKSPVSKHSHNDNFQDLEGNTRVARASFSEAVLKGSAEVRKAT